MYLLFFAFSVLGLSQIHNMIDSRQKAESDALTKILMIFINHLNFQVSD